MAVWNVSANAFMAMGLNIKNKNENWRRRSHARNLDDFSKWCGASTDTCSQVWAYTQEHCGLDVGVIKPIHLLLALRFLRSYDYEWKLGDDFNLSDTTVRKYLRLVLPKLHRLKQLKVCRLLSLVSSC